MPDGKSCNKDDDFFPVFDQVAQAEGCYEQDMVHGFPGEDMLRPDTEIKLEVFHARFVKLSRLLSYQNLLFKWWDIYLNGWARWWFVFLWESRIRCISA